MKQLKFSWWRRYICFLFLLGFMCSFGQTNRHGERKRQRIGLNYGLGTQQSFPFSSDSYNYDVSFIKFNYLKILTRGDRLNLGFSIEPGLYQSRVTDSSGEQRDPGTGGTNQTADQTPSEQTGNSNLTSKRMNEYALNIGVHMFYRIQKKVDGYLLGSIGPMFLDTQTSIQKKGLAFSDIVAIGFLYHLNDIIFDLRFGLRHISNAGIGDPNAGYNSANLEMGFSIPLNKTSKKSIATLASQSTGDNHDRLP